MVKIQVATSLGLSITSHATDRGETFPFVTLPDFEVQAQKALNLSVGETLQWIPKVEAAQQQSWETYTVLEGPKWMSESLTARGFPPDTAMEFTPYIHDGRQIKLSQPFFTGDEPLSGLYYPIW